MLKPHSSKIIIFDTTLRDGELTPGVQFDIYQKIEVAKHLENLGVDIIEVGYPGAYPKDFDAIYMVAKQIKKATICGLASSHLEEIIQVGLALKSANQKRIHLYTPVNLKDSSEISQKQTLELIQKSVKLARNYCDDIEWTGFDAPRSSFDFLCHAIETAMESGAKTVSIPDSLGLCSTEDFTSLIQKIIQFIPDLHQTIISVHCHDDLGLAVENSLAAIDQGARQIECAINGLGARKGNANLAVVVNAIASLPNYYTEIQTDLLPEVSDFLAKITCPGY